MAMGLLITGAVVVTGGILLMATGGGGRAPYLDEVEPASLEDIDVSVCFAFQAGAAGRGPLLLSALQRLHPDVPWPARGADHPTVRDVSDIVAARVDAFLAALAAGEDPCAMVDDGELPSVGDEPGGGPGLGEVPMDPSPAGPPSFSPIGAAGVDNLVSNTPAPGYFYRVRAGDDPTRVARAVFNLPVGDPRTADVLRAITRSGWNLHFFSRRQQGAAFSHVNVAGRWYDIGAAFYPRNTNAYARARARELPRRTVSASGAKLMQSPWQDSRYGMLFIPWMELVNGEVMVPGGQPFDADWLPPVQLLTWLGTSAPDLAQRWGEPV